MSLFSDHMILQRDIPTRVWGWSQPGDSITVEFADQRQSTTTTAAGDWSVTLDPLGASPEPRDMRIHSLAHQQPLTIRDILVGEVWICSGQSNMEMPVGNTFRPDVYPGVVDFNQEIAAANHPQIRMFLVEHQAAAQPMPDVPSPGWKIGSPENVARFSATGYFFARHIHQQLKVPVGMISSAWSSTTAEAWSSPLSLRRIPKTAKSLARLEAFHANRSPAPLARREDPAALFHGMIAPLIPYAMRGVIWYQGENNANSPEDYQKSFPALIQGWREAWALPQPLHMGAPGGNFPFLFVQLAGYRAKTQKPVENGWANLREAQSAALTLPNTGMAVTIDIGHTSLIHPPNKQDVGRRLGLLARSVAYGESIEASGPRFQSMRVDGTQLRVRFTHCNGGLISMDGLPLRSFAMAGEGLTWYAAQARIEKNEAILTCPEISLPRAVCYAWTNHPDANLANQDGLPATPFRFILP